MSGRYLLDTNIVIALFANDSVVIAQLREAEEVFIPSFVIGELDYGARQSRRRQDNLARLDEFVANNVILGCDAETARWYGEVKSDPRHKGRPIPENDIWIAALALQYGLTLVSRDGHFRETEALHIVKW